MKTIKIWLPILLLFTLTVLFVFGLQNDPKKIPSVLIGKKAPEFNLRVLQTNDTKIKKKLNSDSLTGQVWLLNVFASWCITCQIEHKHLMEIAEVNPNLSLVGLAYKDDPSATKLWLEKYGNPYSNVVIDQDGLTGINWGVYAVPETFIIDEKGFIVYKNIGAIDENFYNRETKPLLLKINGKNSKND
jgi:cytochrome c biogenesis protein CcmG/thiol:disulfide interchange protein DsbE